MNMFSLFKRNAVPATVEDGLVLNVGAASDVGQVRSENQDAIGFYPPEAARLFVVCDGMGGHDDGARASRLAIESIAAHLAESADGQSLSLQRAVEAANAEVWRAASGQDATRRMGTTCTALTISFDQVVLAHVGDSRAYRVLPERLEQLSEDHTVAAEMQANGMLTAEEAERHPRKHALTRALGSAADVQVMVREVGRPRAGERFLLCSDGLAPVPLDEVLRAASNYPPQEAAEWLVSQANAHGGKDNISVLIVEVVEVA